MKFVSYLFCLFAVPSLASADQECKLRKPIPIPADFQRAGLFLKNPVLSAPPKISNPQYNPDSSDLFLHVFLIRGVNSSSWGSAIEAYKKNSNSDFIDYVGMPGMLLGEGVGETRETKNEPDGNKTVHFFKRVTQYEPVGGPDDPWYGCPYCRGTVAVEENTIIEENGAIVSISMHFPLFGTWTNPKGVELETFDGEHQDICIYDVEQN